MGLGRSLFYKERSWNDFHFYNGSVLPQVKIVQPSIYHEISGSITTTYHSDYYDRLLPAAERNEGLSFKHDRYSKSKKVFFEDYIGMKKLGKWFRVHTVEFI